MITFKSTEDLSKLSPNDPAYPIIKELVDQLISAFTNPGETYDYEAYGYVILIEEGDVDRELNEIYDGCTLLNIPWEGIALRGSYLVAITIFNDDYGLCVVIPDAPWVNGELRELIEDILDPVELTPKENT